MFSQILFSADFPPNPLVARLVWRTKCIQVKVLLPSRFCVSLKPPERVLSIDSSLRYHLPNTEGPICSLLFKVMRFEIRGSIVFRECPNLPTLLGQKFFKLPNKSFPCCGLITARTLVPSFSSASSPTSGRLIILTSSRNNRSVAARNWRAVNHLCCICLLIL